MTVSLHDQIRHISVFYVIMCDLLELPWRAPEEYVPIYGKEVTTQAAIRVLRQMNKEALDKLDSCI